MKGRVKFGDSKSNRSRDIRVSHFVKNDDDTGVRKSSHKGKRLIVFCLKRLQTRS